MTDREPDTLDGPQALDESAAERRRERRQERRGGRRRPRRALELDTSVPSPCISVCQVDNATGCCIGCYRAIDEIREWPILTADEKRAVLARIADRKTAAEVTPGTAAGTTTGTNESS